MEEQIGNSINLNVKPSEGFWDKVWKLKDFLLGVLVTLLFCWGFHKANNPVPPDLPMSDSTEYWKNRTGEEYAMRVLAEHSLSKAMSQKDSIAAEYERLKEKKPTIITHTETITIIDSIKAETEIVKTPSEYAFNWNYSEEINPMNSFAIKGSTVTDSLLQEAKTTIERMEMKTDLYLSFADTKDDRLSILVRSGNPYMKITNVEGSLIDLGKSSAIGKHFPQKKWGVGVGVGYGVGYDVDRKQFMHGPQVNIGVYRTLFHF